MRVFETRRHFKTWLGLLSLSVFAVQIGGCALAPWETSKPVAATPEERVSKASAQFESNPENTKLREKKYTSKESAVAELLSQAEQARLNGDFESSLALYDRVLAIDTYNQTAVLAKQAVENDQKLSAKVEEATALIEKNQLVQAKDMLHEVLLENPKFQAAISLNQQLDEKMQNNYKLPKLNPSFQKPVTLELRDANIKVVFEALSKATGINFILDKDIRPDTKATIFVKKMPVEDAINLVLSSNGLQKKVLSENSALIYSNNAQKANTYQDLMIRSFYLNNTSAKQMAALLKSMLRTRDIFVDDRLNMLVMRDRPEAIRIAEKLVAANDIADAEVMLEIEVLEVFRSKFQELGVIYPGQLSVLSGDNGLTLEILKNLNSSAIGVSPNPAINFKKTIGDVNLLSNPRIRVKNNEKAYVLVGNKVPIITTTSTANVGISENVTYVDVGLKLNVEPRITLDNFVNINVALEVSSLGDKTITANGATVYTIGTRNANTILRLKDGETQILAGLISDDDRKNMTKVPGLGDIPLIGRLFSNNQDNKSKTEIVLAITPKIINNIQLPKAEISEYWSGTDSYVTDKPQIGPVNGGGAAFAPPLNEPNELRPASPAGDEFDPEAPNTTSGNQPPDNEIPDSQAITSPDPLPFVDPISQPPAASPAASGNKSQPASSGNTSSGNTGADTNGAVEDSGAKVFDTANPPPHF